MKKALLFGIGILLMLAIAVLESQSTKIVPPSSSPQLANVSAATGATTTAPIVAAPVQTAEPSHPVVKVVDGDTLDVLVDGKTNRISRHLRKHFLTADLLWFVLIPPTPMVKAMEITRMRQLLLTTRT